MHELEVAYLWQSILSHMFKLYCHLLQENAMLSQKQSEMLSSWKTGYLKKKIKPVFDWDRRKLGDKPTSFSLKIFLWGGFWSSQRMIHSLSCAKSLSCVQLCNPWTVARQAPLSMAFSRQEYWSGFPCPPPGDLPSPRIEPRGPTLQVDSLPSELSGKPHSLSETP